MFAPAEKLCQLLSAETVALVALSVLRAFALRLAHGRDAFDLARRELHVGFLHLSATRRARDALRRQWREHVPDESDGLDRRRLLCVCAECEPKGYRPCGTLEANCIEHRTAGTIPAGFGA